MLVLCVRIYTYTYIHVVCSKPGYGITRLIKCASLLEPSVGRRTNIQTDIKYNCYHRKVFSDDKLSSHKRGTRRRTLSNLLSSINNNLREEKTEDFSVRAVVIYYYTLKNTMIMVVK